MKWDRIRAGLLVAVVLAAATFAGVTSAASSGSISANPNTPGETATHTSKVIVDGGAVGSSWNWFHIEYNQTDVSNVGPEDIQTIGIDRDNDDSGTTTDVNVSDDLSSVGATSNGHTLEIGFNGNYPLQQGDELVVVFEDAQNPGSAGDYSVTIHVNQQSADETDTATLSIRNPTTQTPTTQTPTTQAPTTQAPTTQAPTTQAPTTQAPTTQAPTTQAPTTTQSTTDEGGGGGGSWGDSSPAVDVTQASIMVNPDKANATATHTVSATIETTGSDSWNSIKINYSGTGTDVSNVDQNDIEKIGIDRSDNNPNTTIDKSVASDLSEVSGSNDGTTLTIGLGGSYFLHGGDEVVVVYEDVQNSPGGQYSIPVDVNHQSSGDTANGSLAIQQPMTTTETSTMTTEATTDSPATTDVTSSMTTAESTPASSPGFTTIASVVALAAAALLVRR